MNADVEAARATLNQTLQAALVAAREHGAILAAVNVEEASAWEAAAERIVPSLDDAVLRSAAEQIGEPRLPELMASHNAAIVDAERRRAELQDAILDPDDFNELSERRSSVDQRLGDIRGRLKELRSRPGMLPLLDAAAKGQRVKPEAQRAIQAHEELHAAVAIVEAEASRLAAVVARHHRAKRDMSNAGDEIGAVGDRVLADARRLVVSQLMKGEGPAARSPAFRTAVRTGVAATAKRAVLTVLYESWVRPHGVALMALEQEATQAVSGFDTVTLPQKIALRCHDAAAAVDAFRRIAAHVAAFVLDDAPVSDWWAALAPTVSRPDDSVFAAFSTSLPAGEEAGVAVGHISEAPADRASDKLAAAWASLQGPADDDASGADDVGAEANAEQAPYLSEEGVDVGAHIGGGAGAFMASDMHYGETDVLMALPKAPSLGQQHTNATEVALTSAEFQAIFDDVHASDGNVFTASPSTDNPFQQRRPEPQSRPDVQFGEIAKPTFSPGSTVGRCTVLGLIGKGGMGEVYRARLEGELGFSRSVVLKRLIIDRDDDSTVLKAFVREAEIAARIAHPNVVQIFDLQSHGGEPFIIMELLEGLSLQKLATRAWRGGLGLEADVLTRCALDAARGLHAAHSMRSDNGALVGLVHRDVAPDNLFLCQNGFTKLLDFGIARRSDLTQLTGKNELKGKIPYMSPEQILGDNLDARSDLFSLGSSLYYLLTGERPFTGDNEVTTLYAVVNKAHRPLRELRPDAEALVAVVEALMQKSRDDRPPSALEVVRLLEQAEPATAEETAAFLLHVETL